MEEPVVGAARPYNDPSIIDIYTGRAGVWAYSPSFRMPPAQAVCNIALTGRRAQDYLVAEAQTHVQHIGGVTVWHHVYNYDPVTHLCTMQLVDWDTHVGTIPHAGGCSQYTQAHGIPYRAQGQDPEDLQKALETFGALEPPAIPLCSARQLEEFTRKTGGKVCSALRALYGGPRAISRQGRALLAAEEDLLLDAVLPLTDDPDGTANVSAVIAHLVSARTAPPPDTTALPFAIDPFGNEFWAGEDGRIYFYDHETDRYQAAERDLGSIIN